ncbi:MAG: hypothetical protein COU29_02365 [Candidatus Magasanikbacteria bacterium CG10_big_fil_rev_8_21_14_0_10_36_32]|uniref:Cytoplasmic protein n=1 Tax=Candidatus Magasanikbacteria bacterium CG10_big_fil_rev_8_21_14_0_10_36_32 TaxID=1974646 RepID=A0A2M6W7C6_9BACT|nr:MAG: hypothetical protein COU29_02365 [Candidatus Magasanikbacteria bacterium CG10_big_fil_rev_8_21_14_0_10_36_32]
MPSMNKTGPMGRGAMTGRGLGPCGGGMTCVRRRSGCGLGWRKFWGYDFTPILSKKDETEMLSEETKILEEELKNIKSRLAEIKDQK